MNKINNIRDLCCSNFHKIVIKDDKKGDTAVFTQEKFLDYDDKKTSLLKLYEYEKEIYDNDIISFLKTVIIGKNVQGIRNEKNVSKIYFDDSSSVTLHKKSKLLKNITDNIMLSCLLNFCEKEALFVNSLNADDLKINIYKSDNYSYFYDKNKNSITVNHDKENPLVTINFLKRILDELDRKVGYNLDEFDYSNKIIISCNNMKISIHNLNNGKYDDNKYLNDILHFIKDYTLHHNNKIDRCVLKKGSLK